MTSMTSSGTGLESIPVGFRFHPTDEELVSHYLRLKMQGREFEVRAIREVNLLKHEPWELPGLSVIPSDDQEWFFFCAREIKYSSGSRSRANRSTKRGYWKSTGKDRNIKAKRTKNVIGTKKTLVFHEGRVPNGFRSPWVIHEYQLAPFNPLEKAFVLCRLFKKVDVRTNEAPCDDGDVSSYAASDFEGQVLGHTIPEIHEFNQVDADLAFQPQREDYDMAASLQFEEYNQREPPVVDPTFADDLDFYLRQYPSDDNEQDKDQFVNSLLNQDEYAFEEFRQSNDSRAPETSIKIYYNGGLSSDSDTDTAQAWHQKMPMIYSGTAFSSNRGQYKEKGNGVVLDASSVDSAADFRRVCSTQSRGLRSPPRSRHSVEQRAAPRKFQVKSSSLKVVSLNKAKDASRLSITTNLPQKERSITESDKEQKMAQGTNADNSPKLKKVRSASSDQKGSRIFQETSPQWHESSPPSVYVVKMLIGIFLFVVIIREMLLYGNWC